MDLKIKDNNFIVCGATSGFGHAITKLILKEGGNVIAVARGEDKLRELEDAYSGQVETLVGNITESRTIERLHKMTLQKNLSGILVNAAGPPAKKFVETRLTDWDEAYQQLVRWKIELTQKFLPIFLDKKYGRFVYIESSSVKQPLENLVLSTSMRLSVVGFVKTLSQEIPDQGVTFNILAPGYHYTPAVERLIRKKAESGKISLKEAQRQIENTIPMQITGDINHFASLAVWLLSPLSQYVTGQVYAVDGGVIKSTL
jgi:3-oxoacyl-[acyl-carrier protein] reductase